MNLCALLAAALAAFAWVGPVRAATGTLDTGALAPQAVGSRAAAEVINTGAAARTKGGEKPPPPQSKRASPQAGAGLVPPGRARPGE